MNNEAESILNDLKKDLTAYNKGDRSHRYSENIKKMVVKLSELGINRKEIKDHLGISLYSINKWCNDFNRSNLYSPQKESKESKDDRVIPFKELKIQALGMKNNKANSDFNEACLDDNNKMQNSIIIQINHRSGFSIEVRDLSMAKFILSAIASL